MKYFSVEFRFSADKEQKKAVRWNKTRGEILVIAEDYGDAENCAKEYYKSLLVDFELVKIVSFGEYFEP